MLILYLDRVEDIEHSKFRALAEIMLTVGADKQDAGIEAFEDYMNKAFPGVKTKKKKKHDMMMDALKQWVGQGPVSIKPLGGLPTKAKSKMVSRISSIETGEVAKATAKVAEASPR